MFKDKIISIVITIIIISDISILRLILTHCIEQQFNNLNMTICRGLVQWNLINRITNRNQSTIALQQSPHSVHMAKTSRAVQRRATGAANGIDTRTAGQENVDGSECTVECGDNERRVAIDVVGVGEI